MRRVRRRSLPGVALFLSLSSAALVLAGCANEPVLGRRRGCSCGISPEVRCDRARCTVARRSELDRFDIAYDCHPGIETDGQGLILHSGWLFPSGWRFGDFGPPTPGLTRETGGRRLGGRKVTALVTLQPAHGTSIQPAAPSPDKWELGRLPAGSPPVIPTHRVRPYRCLRRGRSRQATGSSARHPLVESSPVDSLPRIRKASTADCLPFKRRICRSAAG